MNYSIDWDGPGERDDELKPHHYSPDYQAMGDCRVCGRTRDAWPHWDAGARAEIARLRALLGQIRIDAGDAGDTDTVEIISATLRETGEGDRLAQQLELKE
ncbi:MAG: hypothetical protein U1E40_10885 [Amaricoccus sp.]